MQHESYGRASDELGVASACAFPGAVAYGNDLYAYALQPFALKAQVASHTGADIDESPVDEWSAICDAHIAAAPIGQIGHATDTGQGQCLVGCVELARVQPLPDGTRSAVCLIERGDAILAIAQGFLHAQRVIARSFQRIGGFLVALVHRELLGVALLLAAGDGQQDNRRQNKAREKLHHAPIIDEKSHGVDIKFDE